MSVNMQWDERITQAARNMLGIRGFDITFQASVYETFGNPEYRTFAPLPGIGTVTIKFKGKKREFYIVGGDVTAVLDYLRELEGMR